MTEDIYAAVIRDLRAKRDKIDATIKSLEELSAGGMVSSEEVMSASTGGQIFDTLMNSVKPGEFHGLSYPAAARKILAKTDKHPLTTPQLMQIIEKSGRKVEGKNPLGTIYSSLSRNSDFQKVAENTWGLSEWYPSGAKKPSKVKLSEDEDMEESETQGERESQEKQE